VHSIQQLAVDLLTVELMIVKLWLQFLQFRGDALAFGRRSGARRTSKLFRPPIPFAIISRMNPPIAGIAAAFQREIEAIEAKIKYWTDAGVDLGAAWRDADRRKLDDLRQKMKDEMETKRVVVLATVHEFQLAGMPMNSELCSRVQFLVEQFAATVVLEEWTENQSPSCIAVYTNGRVDYESVGTSSEGEFKTYSCSPVNHPAHDGILRGLTDAPSMSEYGPINNQENREIQMVKNIQQKMKQHRVGLFVVGDAHLHSTCMKLREAGFNVTAYSWLGG
jgi:hypothetical protein